MDLPAVVTGCAKLHGKFSVHLMAFIDVHSSFKIGLVPNQQDRLFGVEQSKMLTDFARFLEILSRS